MTNSIEKVVELNAPVERVWRAITDADQFGQWFGVRLDGPFLAGQVSTGRFTHTEEFSWRVNIDRIEPMTLFAFFWHPYALKPDIDYSTEEPTLVVFNLEPMGDGVRLTVTESGFDKVPEYRRAEAFAMNTRGWNTQAERIKAYVEA